MERTWAPGHPTREERDWLRSEINRLRRVRVARAHRGTIALDRELAKFGEGKDRHGMVMVRKEVECTSDGSEPKPGPTPKTPPQSVTRQLTLIRR